MNFCSPFPLQTVCIRRMIVMAPNNPRDDPVLRGKLEGVWKASLEESFPISSAVKVPRLTSPFCRSRAITNPVFLTVDSVDNVDSGCKLLSMKRFCCPHSLHIAVHTNLTVDRNSNECGQCNFCKINILRLLSTLSTLSTVKMGWFANHLRIFSRTT